MSQCFLNFKQNEKHCINLLCFHYGGGSASAYKDWAKDIIKQVNLIAVQLPGREGRFNEPLLTKMDEVIQELYNNFNLYKRESFIFFGHSIGAIIAFEFARTIRKFDKSFKLKHLIVSGTKAPQLFSSESLTHTLSNDEFLQEISKYNGVPSEIIKNEELMSVFLPIIKADFTISETYTYSKGEVLNCPITALGGINDYSFNKEDLIKWNQQTSSLFKHFMLPGDHFFIRSSFQKVISIINSILIEEIKKC